MHNQPELTVWYGDMPESNGKSNWTAILCRKNAGSTLDAMTSGITIARSEYPGRVKYEADRMRYLIGELAEEPDILAYDTDEKSDYAKAHEINPQEQVDHGVELAQLIQKSVLNHIRQFHISPKLLQPGEEMVAESEGTPAESHNFDICQHFDHWLLSKGTYITTHTEESDGPLAPSLNWIASVEAMLTRAKEAIQQPEDPMAWPLPCDLTAGGVTISKGCPLSTVQTRLELQAEANKLLVKRLIRELPNTPVAPPEYVLVPRTLMPDMHVRMDEAYGEAMQAGEIVAPVVWAAIVGEAEKAQPTAAPHPDTELLDWLEEQVLDSKTGISIDRVNTGPSTKGFRFLKYHYLGSTKRTFREAIEYARNALSGGQGAS
jgi:hypothetical protein